MSPDAKLAIALWLGMNATVLYVLVRDFTKSPGSKR